MIPRWKRLVTLSIVLAGVILFTRPDIVRLDDQVPRKIGPQPDGSILVPTNQFLRPAGFQVQFPGRPTDLAFSPDGSLLAVKNIGDLVLIRMQDRTILQTLTVERGGQGFHGILFSADGKKLYATDSESRIHVASVEAKNILRWSDPIFLPGPAATAPETPGLSPTEPTKNPSSPGGLALEGERHLLWVTLSRNNSLGCVDLSTGKLISQVPVGMAPYTVVLASNRKAYVSNWAGRKPRAEEPAAMSSGTRVLVNPENGVAASGSISVVDLESGTELRQIEVGLHPSGMALSSDLSRLFVANANSDTVSVIDTAADRVVETISVVPPSRPSGSSPNALAVSADDGTLYVANGTDNAVCVVSLGARAGSRKTGAADSRVAGYIPAGWYPGAVLIDAKRGLLIVANTKGIGSRNQRSDRRGYTSHDHSGSISFIPIPADEVLARYTQEVHRNNNLQLLVSNFPQGKLAGKPVPVPDRVGRASVFKHVLYIIKKNRTYDQVFGDMPQGDGDPALVQFGREVTPNHHALAEQFVLLDNFYCSGVLSADGHQWATEAFVTDYLEKSFGGFNRSYPYNGTDPMAYAATGFIWDEVLKKGLTFRNYGEFVQARITPRNIMWKDVWRDFNEETGRIQIHAETQVDTLRPYLCPTFIGFPSTVPDAYRAREFIKELKEFESKGSMPNFMIMLLPNDHTSGTRPNVPTPRAMVADNDLALGRIVEAVSKSRFWPETVIFVTEDDPQAGLDHVDGHRTVGLVISPYTRRGAVVHQNYNQTGMLRTIELILGLLPMNRFDRGADAMTDCFQEKPDTRSFTALPNIVPLDEMNPPLRALAGKPRYWAQKSLELDLDDVDRADEDTLNRILWHSVKGYDVPYPTIAGR
ncbi:MAG TPA: alkaline phosphatase family protein [Acidobacteriota bacterium]|nr:alkaline phosphatase family protein [Acidobacteriota bacterium]